ncbi:hypothetical protein TIFTF001_032037 [Ficus carica]|uniref:Uncharacterized protein n=1 Tax=Ficus carica TaxID=3494 RepID=A0AA88J772_FICCA|nr:hypothetical protein TIFTF001_031994 [Ficus carica]GMN62944.1 hypothetical protein TIFTF001_032037 [Ficus carica]
MSSGSFFNLTPDKFSVLRHVKPKNHAESEPFVEFDDITRSVRKLLFSFIEVGMLAAIDSSNSVA